MWIPFLLVATLLDGETSAQRNLRAHTLRHTLRRRDPTDRAYGFWELQEQQRGTPESLFHERDNPGASYSAIYQWCMEHTGDLIHRAAFGEWGGGWHYGWGAVAEKVDKLFRTAKRMGPGGGDDIDAQVVRNIRYWTSPEGARYREPGTPDRLEDVLAKMHGAGLVYAKAYRKLVPLTRLQQLGRQAAINLGVRNWPAYRGVLAQMKGLIEEAEAKGEGAMEELYFRRLPAPTLATDPDPK